MTKHFKEFPAFAKAIDLTAVDGGYELEAGWQEYAIPTEHEALVAAAELAAAMLDAKKVGDFIPDNMIDPIIVSANEDALEAFCTCEYSVQQLLMQNVPCGDQLDEALTLVFDGKLAAIKC